MLNPFTEINAVLQEKKKPLLYPKYTRNIKFSIILSEEALTGLQLVLQKYTPGNRRALSIAYLLELIGYGILGVEPVKDEIDRESGATVSECRQSGFEDAIEGYNQRFLALYGNISDIFQMAYMRGYLEGKFIIQHRTKNET